jgi:hypothetical protein
MIAKEPENNSAAHEADVNVTVRVTPTLRKIMDEHVRRDTHVNVSDFVREAIRAKLMIEAPDLYALIVRGEK